MMNWFNRALELVAGAVLVNSNVSLEIKAERQAICNTCPKHDATDNRCKVCSCFLAVKTGSLENTNPKTFPPRNEITHCPDGKWNDKEIANHYRALDGKPLI